jgi:hypothetical protein
MKSKYYIGFDPSFTDFGVSVIDKETKRIDLSSYKLSPGSKKLKLITWASLNIVEYIRYYLSENDFLNEYTFISQESPAPRAPGSSLPMLWVLGSVVYREFGSLSKYEQIDLYNVMTMRTLHNNKKHTKKDTMLIVAKIIKMMEEEFDYTVYLSKKYDDGMADAFIYSLLGYMKHNDDELSAMILHDYPQFKKIKCEVD